MAARCSCPSSSPPRVLSRSQKPAIVMAAAAAGAARSGVPLPGSTTPGAGSMRTGDWVAKPLPSDGLRSEQPLATAVAPDGAAPWHVAAATHGVRYSWMAPAVGDEGDAEADMARHIPPQLLVVVLRRLTSSGTSPLCCSPRLIMVVAGSAAKISLMFCFGSARTSYPSSSSWYPHGFAPAGSPFYDCGSGSIGTTEAGPDRHNPGPVRNFKVRPIRLKNIIYDHVQNYIYLILYI